MDLHGMIYQRMTTNAELADMLAKYDDRPAVFYQRAAPASSQKWGGAQYPRIDYIVDMLEDPTRNSSGILTVNVWCDTAEGAAPEDMERLIRDLFHANFAATDDYPYCFAWVRSEPFEVKTESEINVRTVGFTIIFDLMAYPSQFTISPDPIRAMNTWAKTVIPNALVIGHDTMSDWKIPTRDTPIIYWRNAGQAIYQRHHVVTWLNVAIEGHVYAKSADDRLYNLIRLNTAAALIGHVKMEDDSPLFLLDFALRPSVNYLAQGQIHINGRFGILQPSYTATPANILNDAHISIN